MEERLFAVNETDLKTVEIYKDFLPEQIFDAHTHMYYGPALPSKVSRGPALSREFTTPVDYEADLRPFFPGVKSFRMHMMPDPDRALTDTANGLRDLANAHVYDLAGKYPQNAVSPYVLQADSREYLWELASRPETKGFKCYSYGAGKPDLESLAIGEYLSEAMWEVADAKGLPITLHLFRRGALADPDNLSYINTMAKKYPNAKLVLAHCGRGFAAWTAVKGIRALEDCGNIWFDMAAVCESGPMMASILKNAGKRTVWGTDYPICMNRGRAISLGIWQDWLVDPAGSALDRTYIVAESLMAFYQTALLLDLDQTQLEDIFYNNALELYGLSNGKQTGKCLL